ncbi:hypothetical protein D3C72_1183860 [compost metagenome]
MQNFFCQIIQHEMVVARERPKEQIGVMIFLYGDRSQVQTRNPAFGTCLEPGYVIYGQVKIHCTVKKSFGFGKCKSHVGNAQLC